MKNDPPKTQPDASPRLARLDGVVRGYPQLPFVAPFMVFLVLMLLDDAVSPSWRAGTYAVRSIAGLWAAWALRRFLPPLGRLHLGVAIPIGLLVAFGWVEVHHLLAGCTHDPCRMLGLFGVQHQLAGWSWYAQHLTFDGDASTYFIPADHFNSAVALWTFLIIRVGGAAITVPVIEELFWRGFVLRLLINWHRFEDVKLATFTVRSFVVCSLLSAVQHPGQWEVGILCWMVYNAVFYWKKSLACCMVAHGVTNLALYVYVYNAEDWRFW